MCRSSFQLLKFHSISKFFGPKQVLCDVDLTISRGQRIALIGENGSGKSTLARIAVQELNPDAGSVSSACEMGYLCQETPCSSETPIRDYLMEAYGNLHTLSSRLRQLEEEISCHSTPALLDEWEAVHEEFLAKGGYEIASQKEKVLAALGLSEVEEDRTMGSLSGGERRRVQLAAFLLARPDLLILDEPTNHLDTDAVEWLEGYLQSYSGALLLITHDRTFLNRVATGVYELSEGTLRYYEGNYESYRKQKEAEERHALESYRRQVEEVSTLKKKVKEQTYASSSPGACRDQNKMAYDRRGEKHVKSKRKKILQMRSRLEELAQDSLENPVPKRYQGMVFHSEPLLSDYAIRLENVSHPPLIKEISTVLRKGDRIILKGPNGCGKSTLLRALAEQGQLSRGTIVYSPQIIMGYLPQESSLIEGSESVLEYLSGRLSISEDYLGRKLHQIGLLKGREIGIQVSRLSMGQRRRLQLLELMLTGVNVLLLDEPTNHLAPLVVEELEEALMAFPGAILAATHDRSFADHVGTDVWSPF